MNRPVITVILLFAAAASAAGCGDEQAAAKAERPAPEPVAVTTTASRVGAVQREVRATGNLYGDEEATLSAKVAGRITRILKDVGDRARPGEPLAQIDPTDYELAVAQKQMAVQSALAKLGLSELPPEDFDLSKVPTVQRARLQAENAEAKFNRGRQLHEQTPPLISDQDFADLRTAFDVARSNYDVELLTARSLLAEARALRSDHEIENQRLRDATVRAPIDNGATTMASTATTAPAATQPAGSGAAAAGARFAVAARQVSVGEYVSVGTPLFRVVADDPIKLRSMVPEVHLGRVRVGQKVRVSVDAYPNETFDGTVTRMSPQVEQASRSFQVEVLVPNPDGRLQPGSFARLAILTRQDEGVTLVPMDALVTFAGVTKVFAIEGGKAVEHKIETGQQVGDLLEVRSGLKGETTLALTGRNRLSNGTPVKIGAPATAPAASAR